MTRLLPVEGPELAQHERRPQPAAGGQPAPAAQGAPALSAPRADGRVDTIETTEQLRRSMETRRSGPTRRAWRPRLHPALIVVAGVCAVLFRPAMRSGLSGDIFYEVAAGRWMLAHHAIARYDVFSYTVKGHPWTDEEWGFQVLIAWLVAHIGPVSYWLVSAGACVGAVVISVARWRRLGAGWLWTGALSVLAGAGLYVFVTPRPQDLSYLLFAALVLLLTLARGQARWLVVVPPLMMAWANLHGSFLMGIGLLVLEVICAVLPDIRGRFRATKEIPLKALAATTVASIAATLVNPNGPGLLSYAMHVSSAPQLTSLIAEWQSPDFHSIYLLGVIIGPVLFFIGLLAFSNTVFALEDVVVTGALFLATLHAGRFMPYFALAMCSVLARWVPIRNETIRPSLVTLPVAAIACLALLSGPVTHAGDVQKGRTSMDTPVAATNFLKHQKGRVFATYWWDDYLVYEHVPVFVDGRTDMYFGTGVLDTYVDVLNLSVGPDNVFRRWDVQWVMWDKGTSLAVYLAHDRAWRQVFQRGDAVIFEHVGSW